MRANEGEPHKKRDGGRTMHAKAAYAVLRAQKWAPIATEIATQTQSK
jgi:hypothetical protein